VIHRDYIAPSAPFDLIAKENSKSTIGLNWVGSSDLDVESYLIYVNQTDAGAGGPYVLQDKVDSLIFYYDFTHLIEDTAYYFVVSAIDEANNTSPYSNEAWNNTITTPERPQVTATEPLNNSIDVPVNITVVITFSMSMDKVSISDVFSISPSVGYNLNWSDNDHVLLIDFINNLTFNKSYNIIIGAVKSTSGTTLEKWPFILSFRTEEKKEITPIPKPNQKITIISPTANTVVKPGELINVSGTSTNLAAGILINVSLGELTETGNIDIDGTWVIAIKAPVTVGNYTIDVIAGGLSDSVLITVEAPDEVDDTGEEDTEDLGMFGMGSMIDIMIILLIIIIVIIIILISVMKKKKDREGITEDTGDELEDEQPEETAKEDGIEEEDWDEEE
jgi:hypothetical protein